MNHRRTAIVRYSCYLGISYGDQPKSHGSSKKFVPQPNKENRDFGITLKSRSIVIDHNQFDRDRFSLAGPRAQNGQISIRPVQENRQHSNLCISKGTKLAHWCLLLSLRLGVCDDLCIGGCGHTAVEACQQLLNQPQLSSNLLRQGTVTVLEHGPGELELTDEGRLPQVHPGPNKPRPESSGMDNQCQLETIHEGSLPQRTRKAHECVKSSPSMIVQCTFRVYKIVPLCYESTQHDVAAS